MRLATASDKNTVVNILTNSFNDNKSVNYLIPQDQRREQRLRNLMEYSFNYCQAFGDVFLSDDGKACALIIYPDRKKTTPKSLLLDIKLVFTSIGPFNLKKALKRESIINKLHEATKMDHLWFIGVRSEEQSKGVGSALLQDILHKRHVSGRPMYLETSTERNIRFYRKFGFEIYKELDFGYKLYCLKHSN